ncbi:Flp1 family type IVb pilin [Anaerocolumna sp. AGMB13020]|uniref:Flp1 family type IVb pilin n=1 Tax=Anaerocolumna sp. AGMB13020 TaxID=3081750 RepID=UPI0029559708|nr:Flp1 family type IVb pilin [Anaerocolumna sp. AGMB13020]WOO34517.1 Flp1 family type IVb pilin [Anaerocolumna sp. AGMB13020]
MKLIKDFIREEDGIGVVEIILILVVLIGIAIIFRETIMDIVNGAISRIKEDATPFYED